MYKVSKLAAGSVIAATAAVAGSSVTLADVYEQPRRVVYERPMDWSGVYFGVGSGYQWSTVDVDHVNGLGFNAGGIGISSQHDDAFVSAHLGAQHQFGAIVLGVEGGWMTTLRDRDGSSERCDSVPGVLSNPIIAPGDFCRGRLQDIFTIGGRAGYAAGKWLPYVTGGYANAGVDFENRVPGVSPGVQSYRNKRMNGLAVGSSVAAWSGPSRRVGRRASNTATTSSTTGTPRRSPLAQVLLPAVCLGPWAFLWSA